MTFTQPILGFGNLTIEAGGASTTHNQYWTLQGGASTFTGDVTLRTDGSANAWLTLDGGSLPANSVLTLEDSSIPAVGGNNAVLDLNGQDQTLGGLASISGAGGLGSFVTNSGGSQSTLTIDGVFDHVFGGTIGANAAASLTGQGAGGDDIALVKDGGGTLFLNGVNTYTGDTTILAGKIEFITSNFSNTSTVTLDGGTLSLVNAGTDIVGSLIINGEVQLGAGAIYNEGNTAGAIVGLGEIQVGVVAGSFDAWVTGAPYNLAGADAEPDADPDHDGIANSVEFVVGGNPADMSDTDKLPMGAVVGTKLEFTYRLTDDSAYLNPTVEYGSDLISWTTAEGNVGGVTIGAPTDLGNGVKQIVVAIPMNAEAKRFARLRVVVP